jgi:hypothetical protein
MHWRKTGAIVVVRRFGSRPEHEYPKAVKVSDE